MKLQVSINGTTGELQLEREGDQVRFQYDGAPGEASIVEVEPGIFSVLWNGRSYEVKAVRNHGIAEIEVAGRQFQVQAVDPRELPAQASAADASGSRPITASMPGKVIRVLVEQEQLVEAGQGILVVEAMKMQNEMQAPRSGKVVSVKVKAGDAVAAGEVLAVIE